MKKIDIEKLSRATPFAQPSESYFERLPLDTLEKLKASEREVKLSSEDPVRVTRLGSIKRTITYLAVAAMVGVVVLIGAKLETSSMTEQELDIESFVTTLSDSDLQDLIDVAESNYEFYTNI